MGAMASQITSVTIAYSNAYSGADQRKHRSLASLAFVRGIHRWPVNSLHKWTITRKMFPFNDVIMSRIAVSIVPGVISILMSIPLLNFRMYILCGPTKFMPDDHGLCTLGCSGDLSVLSFSDLRTWYKCPETFFIKFSKKKQSAGLSRGSFSLLLVCNNMTYFSNWFTLYKFSFAFWEV